MEKLKPKRALLLILCLFTAFFSTAFADSDDAAFTKAQQQKFIQDYSLKYHLPSSYIKDTLSDAVFIQSSYDMQEAIANAPITHAKGKSWAAYRKQFINPVEISRGEDFMCKHQATLAKAQAKYGVPSSVIMGIIGVETSYGTFIGHYRVLDTLTTLAFNSPRRIDFWQDELAQYILMCYQYKLDPTQLIGAIDGGFGLGQFMPSAYLNFAVSAVDGNAPNLMQADDAIMSVANYLKQHGWKSGQAVVLNAKRSKNTCRALNCNQKKLSYTLNTWKRNGITVQNQPPGNPMADIVLLQDSPQTWMALNNFYTIFSYNHSQKYAMAVYQLGVTVAASVARSGC